MSSSTRSSSSSSYSSSSSKVLLLLRLLLAPIVLMFFVLLLLSAAVLCRVTANDQQAIIDLIKSNSLIESSSSSSHQHHHPRSNNSSGSSSTSTSRREQPAQDAPMRLEALFKLVSNGQSKESHFSPSDDPELDMSTPELITHRGYPVEVHLVTTADGYILEVHRIPGSHRFKSRIERSRKFGKKYAKRVRPVVFLQHGLLCSSSDWVLNPTDRGLAYMLADRGYDVWMGNARGNTYSHRHMFLKESDEAFWKFTWDEMGMYDIPAELNYILNVTGQKKLTYVGHSMGTTMFWVAMENHPELNDKIELMVGLAPVASVARMKSPIKILAPYVNQLKYLFEILGTKAFLPSGPTVRLLSKYVCDQTKWEADICENIFFLLSGSDPVNFNEDMVPIITAHTPAGTSTYTIIHYMQEFMSEARYQKMDWGTKENMIQYGQPTPPPYNLTAVSAPVVVFYGDNDWLATPKDVTWLAKRLPNLQGFYRVNMTAFNHLDFLWATAVDDLLYNQLLELIPFSY